MDQASQIVVGLVLLVVVVIVTRAIWLWYWKVNEIVKLLRDISASLRIMRGVSAEVAAPVPWYDEAGALHSERDQPSSAGTPTFRSKREYAEWKEQKAEKAEQNKKIEP